MESQNSPAKGVRLASFILTIVHSRRVYEKQILLTIILSMLRFMAYQTNSTRMHKPSNLDFKVG